MNITSTLYSYPDCVCVGGWVGWGMILQVWLVPVWLCEKDSVSLMTWYRLLKWINLQNCCFGDIHHPPKVCSLRILHCHIAFIRDCKILSVKWWCLSNSYTKMKDVYAVTLFTRDGLQTHTRAHTKKQGEQTSMGKTVCLGKE